MAFNHELCGAGKSCEQIAQACEHAVQAHKLVNERYGWVPSLGWDCMLDEDNEMLWFEGNQASNRLPRVFFINFWNLIDLLRDFFWPFDDKYNVQPLHTQPDELKKE